VPTAVRRGGHESPVSAGRRLSRGLLDSAVRYQAR